MKATMRALKWVIAMYAAATIFDGAVADVLNGSASVLAVLVALDLAGFGKWV
jgi:hypothetical protein